MGKRVLTSKQQFWLDHLQCCVTQKISMKAYAEHHGLQLGTFYYWKKYLGKIGVLDKKPVFVKAVLPQPQNKPQNTGSKTSISLSNGVLIEISHDFDASVLAELIALARRL